MKKAQFVVILVGVLFLLSTPALATTWSDYYYPAETPLYMVAGDEETISFDITDDGFDPGFWNTGLGGDNVLWYEVEIYATDDLFGGGFSVTDLLDWGSRGEEYYTISTGWWYGDPQSFEVGLGTDTYEDNFLGLLDINLINAGVLNFNLVATQGDFNFWGAKLTASDTTPVPEPGTIVLMGLGLVGLAGMGRKKLFKK